MGQTVSFTRMKDGTKEDYALIYAEEHIRKHHPPPARSPDDEEGNGEAHHPTGDEDRLPPEPVRERTGEGVHDGLRRAERDQKGERRRECGQAEDVPGQERQQRPLLADHPSNQGVDPDQEDELRQVGA